MEFRYCIFSFEHAKLLLTFYLSILRVCVFELYHIKCAAQSNDMHIVKCFV